MALKAFVNKVFGWGKHKEEKQKVPRIHPYDEVSDDQASGKAPRQHPYDEVSDDHLDQNRRQQQQQQPARLHPYEDVSDATLEDNRNKKAAAPARRHNYDEVDLDPTTSKVNKPTLVNGKKKNSSDMNYVEVELTPGVAANRQKMHEDDVVYSQVRASTAENLKKHPRK